MVTEQSITGASDPASKRNRLKVMLVDDNLEFLEIAAGYLSRHRAMEIVGRAASGKRALQMVNEVAPDLVLMDLSMPDMNGLETTRRIKALPLPPQVIILTLYEAPEFYSSAQSAGADGFITKSEFGDRLMPLIFKHFPRLENDADPKQAANKRKATA